MKKKIIYITSLILIMGYGSMLQAQITIGSKGEPAKGMLLQLKDKEPDAKNVTADKGGLVLPRVSLVKETELKPFLSTATPADKLAHEGLLVYNLSNKSPFCPGLYVWSKGAWVELNRSTDWDHVTENLNKTKGTGTIKTQDGKTYSVGYYEGAGWWMTQNLATEVNGCRELPLENYTVVPEHGGTNIQSATEPRVGYARVNIPSGDYQVKIRPADFDTNYLYGMLYNWTAATLGQNKAKVDQNISTGLTDPPGAKEVESMSGHIQGICPKGWHLPSARDWALLLDEVGKNPSNYASGYTASELANALTNVSVLMQAPGHLANAAYSYGRFSKPKDKRGFYALMISIGYNGWMETGSFYTRSTKMWSSSSHSFKEDAYCQTFVGEAAGGPSGCQPARYDTFSRKSLLSVRCKRDKND